MVEVVEYRPEHLVKLQLRLEQAESKPVSINTYAVTFLYLGQPIAIFGAFFPISGVAHVWGMVSPEVGKIPHIFFRAVKRHLSHVETTLKFRRIQIEVREDFIAGHKFAHALDFNLEARLNHYNPDGSNAMLYARTP